MSNDWNDIDLSIVKNVIEKITEPTHICKLSLKIGTFPQNKKSAKVTPVYKTGDKHNFKNYRPVLLLSQFSRILEKPFSEQIFKFVDKNNILSNDQYGFRSQRSISLALLAIIEEITKYIDSKQCVAGVFW